MPAGELNVFAIPDETADIGGDRLKSYRKSVPAKAAAAGYDLLLDYPNANDLIGQIKDLLKAKPQKCLRRLEILAHSSPAAANGLDDLTIGGFVSKFKKVRLCDRVEVWLSGCNTGLVPTWGKNPTAIPKRMVDRMPFDNATFPVRVTVYGSVGYLEGTHLQGDTSTKKKLPTVAGHGPYPQYPGAEEKTGDACYKAFNNW